MLLTFCYILKYAAMSYKKDSFDIAQFKIHLYKIQCMFMWFFNP